MIRLTPPEGDLRAGGRGSAEAHQIRAGRLTIGLPLIDLLGRGHVMPAGNPAPSRAHRELALPLRGHKDRPRFDRPHDCGLGELGFAGGHREYRRLAPPLAEKDCHGAASTGRLKLPPPPPARALRARGSKNFIWPPRGRRQDDARSDRRGAAVGAGAEAEVTMQRWSVEPSPKADAVPSGRCSRPGPT